VALNLRARKVPRFSILVELEAKASGKAGKDTETIEVSCATQQLLLCKTKNLSLYYGHAQARNVFKVAAKSSPCEQVSKAEYKKTLTMADQGDISILFRPLYPETPGFPLRGWQGNQN
jgi:hypothetical protein